MDWMFIHVFISYWTSTLSGHKFRYIISTLLYFYCMLPFMQASHQMNKLILKCEPDFSRSPCNQSLLLQTHTPLHLLLEAVRSVLMVSDIFTERSQFQWMLHTFIELGKNHPSEDELLHQFLTLGVCKAAAVLGQVHTHSSVLPVMLNLPLTLQDDVDVLEKVRKMTDNSLRSGFLPSRLCGLHGILHLLQAPRCLSQPPVEDTLQLAIDYIQRHMDLASGLVQYKYSLNVI